MKCIECGKSVMRKSTTEVDFAAGTAETSVTVPSMRCASCGAFTVEAADLQRAEQQAAAAFLAAGQTGGLVFKFARKALGMKAVELGALLCVSDGTISRWESGERDVDRAAWGVLGAMVREALVGDSSTREALEAAKAPKAPPPHLRSQSPRKRAVLAR